MALLLLRKVIREDENGGLWVGEGKPAREARLGMLSRAFLGGRGEILEMLILGSRKKGVGTKETTPPPFEFPISLSAYLQRRSPSTVVGC